MSKYSPTVEQEIIDQGLEHALGIGRGILRIDGVEGLGVEEGVRGYEETLEYIRELDTVGSNGHELMGALSGDGQDAGEVLEAISKSSVRGAVDALLEMGTARQRTYLARRIQSYGEMVRNGIPEVDWDGKRTGRVHSANLESIRTGLWRDAVYASMVGTPELSALNLARRWVTNGESNDEDHRPVRTPNLPHVHGFFSRITPPTVGEAILAGHAADGSAIEVPPESKDGTVGYVFPELVKVFGQVRSRLARKQPDISDAELEWKAIGETARIIAKSTEYDDPRRPEGSSYRSWVEEALAWPQLGEQVQAQLRGMRRKIDNVDLSHIGRFIGKAGDNPYRRDWNKMESLGGDGITPEAAREYFSDLALRETRHHEGDGDTGSEVLTERGAELLAASQLSDDAVLERFREERDDLSRKYLGHMSLAQKAIELTFICGEPTSRGRYGGGPIDWINDAPLGLINRTYKAMSRGVTPETALAYAVAEYTLPGTEITRASIEACRGADRGMVQRTRALSRQCEELGIAIHAEDKLALGQISRFDDAQDVMNLFSQGYTTEHIKTYPWLCRLPSSESVDFPAADSTPSRRQRWCAENAYAYLNGGWNKTDIGKIILTRLEAVMEETLHDASQWLEVFQIPEEGYDIQTLKARVRDGSLVDIGQLEKSRYYDSLLEGDLLASIVSAPQELRARLLLPTKEQKIQQLFFSPENQLIYASLISLYKDGDFSIEKLNADVLGRIDSFYDDYLANARAKETTRRISKSDLQERVVSVLQSLEDRGLAEEVTITGAIHMLAGYGESRKRYIQDATSWLMRHATSPHARLTKAWGDRPTALVMGVDDSARAIERWQADNALAARLDELERTRSLPHNLTRDEVMGEFRAWTDELLRCYSADRTIQALSDFKAIRNPNALLPHAVLSLDSSGGGEYRAEILSKDDPRGVTIGVDTGCCMTLDGASWSCIESGYKDANAGFFALYAPDDRLAAQSYFYVNSDHPDTLVLDNIEANKGRDTNRIIGLYRQALHEYLGERFASDSTWQIRRVQLGTGYGDEIKASALRLPRATIVPNNLHHDIYSDASEDQRLLLELSDDEIAAYRAKGAMIRAAAPEVIPQHLPRIVAHTMTPDYAPVIRGLEKEIYPKHMRQYRDWAVLNEELHMHGADQFSFLIAGETDASLDYVGYCMAYLEKSETEPSRIDPVLYVADLAVVPGSQGGHYGARMFDELLERAQTHDIDKVEFHARETTSYAALTKSSRLREIIASHGYRLVDHGPADEFDDGRGNVEKLYLISLEKATT